MKAGWYNQYGAAHDVIQIGEVATPIAAENEVRVRLFASGINPSDVKKRAGLRGAMPERRIIPHSDGAGVIDQVGVGVDTSRIGERVWVFNGQHERPFGTAAEYITLPQTQVVPLPANVTFAEGACLGIPAMTAHRCLFSDGPIADQSVLVTGGAGAVGHYAIQLAKWARATVITTVSSTQKGDHARHAGADFIINYHTEDVVDKIMEISGRAGVDRIIEVDFGGNLPVSQAILKNNGTIAAYASMGDVEPALPFYPLMFNNISLRLALVYNMPQAAKEQAGKDILQAIKDGKLVHPIATQFPLSQLAKAHEAVESGTYIGNVVVDIAG
ncbi:MAG: NADPH:quinone reductase [Chloroflexi bacterium]|nr:NADPH:quinone reductase [Chloroflexota bacterium]